MAKIYRIPSITTRIETGKSLCFTRSKSKIVEIEFKEKDFDIAIKVVEECLDIIQNGYFPGGTKVKARCNDCTYRNLCIL